VLVRWGTEPEGWYVDRPYAIFGVGVNYSPLEWHRFYQRDPSRVNLGPILGCLSTEPCRP
jgi:hypothetical protein